jgi:hypothetical protein
MRYSIEAPDQAKLVCSDHPYYITLTTSNVGIALHI